MTTKSVGRFSSKNMRNLDDRTAIKAVKYPLGTIIAFQDSLIQLIDSNNIDSVFWSSNSRKGTKIVELAVGSNESLYIFYENGYGSLYS